LPCTSARKAVRLATVTTIFSFTTFASAVETQQTRYLPRDRANCGRVKDMRFQALMPDVLHWLGR